MKKLKITNFPNISYAGQDAVNALCTNLSFSGVKVKKIMITSSHASEGKTFLTMNIMRTMAKNGKKVAFIDADMRKSYITSEYGLQFEDSEHPYGLSHFLAGTAKPEDVVYETDIDGAWMVPVGKTVSNPLPLLNSNQFRALLDYLAANLDYVFIDAPPAGPVIDSSEIAKSCDGILIAVHYDNVSTKELTEIKKQLDQTGCPVLGAVLNRVEFDDFMSQKYYYKTKYSYYGQYTSE
jgi:capsular exopolysaccharide synthesis family protein